MSLLHRWSLPSRGFTREKSQNGEPTDQSKFLTIHVGQLGPHRRANLSSVFSTLFEKPENRRCIQNTDERSEIADDLPLLTSRRENVRPGTESRCSHDHDCQGTITPTDTVPIPQYGRLEPTLKNTTIGSTAPLSHVTSGIFDQVTRQIDGKQKACSFAFSSTEMHETQSRDGSPSLKSTETIDDCEGNVSDSSSYPSEGMRSPVSGYCSPKPAVSHTMNYFTEYRRFGRYPSQSSWHLSSMHINEASASDPSGEKTWTASGLLNATPDCAIASQSSSLEASPFTHPPEDHIDPTCSDTAESQCKPGIVSRMEPQQKPSSSSEIMVPVLENEDAISSQLEVSFMNYKRPIARNTSSDKNGYQIEARNASLIDVLHHSVNKDQTMLTEIRQPSTSNEESAWSTIQEVRERPLSRPASWMQLLALTSSNDSSNTLAQRLQKLKLRQWAKRFYFKTKARFELVGRPVSRAKITGSKARRRKWHHKIKKNRKKVRKGCAKKEKSKRRWSVGETLEVTKKRVMQRMEMADHFFNTLAKKKSLQFALFKSEKEDKTLDTHKRVRSCPAHMGL
ncbi:hypothetical protein F5Y12DRAFT_67506 [Xylaria sp. FL1777]|nr:hypothetical protein F5Y12DRAFT_67506 [Xylaria sp. FL1777]